MRNALTILRWLTALILLQTLYFKFTASAESVYIFTAMDMEPWGRIGSGVAEAIIAILIMFNRTTYLAAIGGVVIMTGALYAHVAVIGYEVMGDNGMLFGMAVFVFLSCQVLLLVNRNQVIDFIRFRKI
jgi:uncharacterized membrane protein YphA (DoxX/SURF4 family)